MGQRHLRRCDCRQHRRTHPPLYRRSRRTAQVSGLEADAIKDIVDHVYAKPHGHINQEIGQVGVSLLGLAEHLHISADDEERKEFDRITSLPPEHWQARQNAIEF